MLADPREEDLDRRELLPAGGYCSETLNVTRYGAAGKAAPNCQANLEAAIGAWGLDRWSFNVDACFNIFDDRGLRPGRQVGNPGSPRAEPGDFMILRALMPQIVAISNCPILFNACKQFPPEAADGGNTWPWGYRIFR